MKAMEVFPCVECAGAGRTCCEHVLVYLTIGDLARISHFTKSEDFFSFEAITERYECEDDPNWLILTCGVDGRRRVVKQAEGQKCMFLAENGCSLPMRVRPLLCRIYPYDFLKTGIVGIDSDCPISEMHDREHILESLGMAYGRVEQWRRILYDEIELEKSKIKITWPGSRTSISDMLPQLGLALTGLLLDIE